MRPCRAAPATRRSSLARRRSRTSPCGVTIARVPLASEACVEPAVLDRFGDVVGTDRTSLRKIGDGACNAQHAVICACREKQARERVTKQLIAFAVGRAMVVDLARAEQGIRLALAIELGTACTFDPVLY